MSSIGNFSSGGIGSPPIRTITGNSGGAVGPAVGGNVNLVGTSPLAIAGNPGTNTLTGSISTATTSATGIIQLATNAQAIAGVDSADAVVPSSLSAKLGTQTANGVAFGQTSTSAIGYTAAGTNGQLLIAASGTNPAFASLTSTGGSITYTSGANSLNLDVVSSFSNSFVTDSGTATPTAGVLTIHGGSNMGTTGAGSTVTLNLVNSPSVSGSVTAGTGLTATAGGITAVGNSSITGGTITLNSGTNALSISTDASATTVNVATGAAIKTATFGSTTASSTTTIQGPSGGVFAVGVAGVTPANINMVTINTSTGQLGSQAVPSASLVLLQTQSASASASLNFTTGFSTANYLTYVLVINNMLPTTDTDSLWLKISSNGGSTWIGGTSYYTGLLQNAFQSATLANVNNSADSKFLIASPVSNSTDPSVGVNSTVNIMNVGTTTKPTLKGNSSYYNGTGYMNSNLTGIYLTTVTVNAIQLIMSTGTIASGTASLYGVQK